MGGSGHSLMGAQQETQDQEDSSPLLEVDPQVEPEFGEAVQPESSRSVNDSVVGAQEATMQLHIAAASFLVTLKEKYKVNDYRIGMMDTFLLCNCFALSDQPVCCRLCC